MIRIAVKVRRYNDAQVIVDLLSGMLGSLSMLYGIDDHWGSGELPRILQQNPFYYDVWVLDMADAENVRLSVALRLVNERTSFVFMCGDDIRRYMLSRPSVYFADVRDMRDHAGYLFDLCVRLKNEYQQLILKCEGEMIGLPFGRLVFFEKCGRNVAMYVDRRQTPYITAESLDAIIDKLPKSDFIRCHQSLIVNLRYVKGLVDKSNPAWPSFVMQNGRYANISRRNSQAVLAAYRQYAAKLKAYHSSKD